MASSENFLAVEQPWVFQRSFADTLYSKDNETLTKALQMSFTGGATQSEAVTEALLSAKTETVPSQTPTASGGSETEAPVSRTRTVGLTKKITKRKSRARKSETTTFIAADPANFRQMVQQVTGVRFGGLNGQVPVTRVLKPEPTRPINRLQPSGGLPTLDTSAFLLSQTPYHLNQEQVDPAAYLVAQPPVQPPQTVVADGGSGGLDFNPLCNFPTLESWKVM